MDLTMIPTQLRLLDVGEHKKLLDINILHVYFYFIVFHT